MFEIAEDFYGNDYPEDEVDSDDEYGRGAYNYRLGVSDDEEYDGFSTSSFGEDNNLTWKKSIRDSNVESDDEEKC